MDSDFFDSIKSKKLRNRFGAVGLSVFLYIVCCCYKENGYYIIIDADLYDEIIDYFRITGKEVEDIINYIVEINLLQSSKITKEINVLTSERIQRNYQEGTKTRGKKNKVKVNKYIWLISEEETEEHINISN